MTDLPPGPPGGDAWIRDLLGSLPEPTMPAEVSIRIQQAIAAESGTTLGDELSARRARNQRWRGAPLWAAGAAAAAVVAAVVIPAVIDSSHGSADTVAGNEASLSLAQPQGEAAGGSAKRAAIPSTISGAEFSTSSLPGDVGRLLASVRQSGSAAQPSSADAYAADSADSADSGAAPAPAAQDPSSTTSSEQPPPIEESCLAVISGSGNVVATDFGFWNDQPAHLIVVDDPRYPDTFTAHVVSPDCTGEDLHQFHEERVARQ